MQKSLQTDVDLKENEGSWYWSIHNFGCLYQRDPFTLGAGTAWHSGLTVKQAGDIERVQKVAVYIILSDTITGNSDFTYDMALALLAIDPLQDRRDTLCLSFAKKTLKSKHSDMFHLNGSQHHTRNKTKFDEVKTNTSRFYKSPLNYLTRLLNCAKWSCVL